MELSGGVLIYAEESGYSSETLRMGCAVIAVSYAENHGLLLVVTEDLGVNVFRCSTDGALDEISRVKLSKWRNDSLHVKWLKDTCPVLAITTSSLTVRLWNPIISDSAVLEMEVDENYKDVDFISSMESHRSGKLAVGTHMGNVFLFECLKSNPAIDNSWVHLPSFSTSKEIHTLQWSTHVVPILMIHSLTAKLYKEQVSATFFSQMVTILQTGPMTLLFKNLNTGKSFNFTLDYSLQGLSVDPKAALIWNGHRVVVYEPIWDIGRTKVIGSFALKTNQFYNFGENIFSIEDQAIFVRNLDGNIKQILNISPSYGCPTVVALNTNCIACITSEKTLKVWACTDNSTLNLIASSTYLRSSYGESKTVLSCGVSANGKYMSFHIKDQQNGTEELVVFSTEKKTSKILNISQENLPDIYDSRTVGRIFWDSSEERVLGLEVKYHTGEEENSFLLLVIVPVLADIYIQDAIRMDPLRSLCGLCLPSYAVLIDTNQSLDVIAVTLPDFGELEEEQTSVSVFIDFSVNLHECNFDKAFKTLRGIRSHSVWRKLARFSILSRRVEAAYMCASYLGMVHAIWSADLETTTEAKLIVLALHLDMIEEAIEMSKNYNNKFWLLKLYELTNQWDKAIEFCKATNAIEKNIIYNKYAKFLEANGEVKAALQHYEAAGCAELEIARLFKRFPDETRNYCAISTDRSIQRWYAKHAESQGDYALAMEFYKKCEDIVSLCRSLCYRNEVVLACDFARKSKNKAACYFMGRHFEVNEADYEKACQYYCEAGAFSTAVRLCKENQLDKVIYLVALQANPQDQLVAAAYLESRPSSSTVNAAKLYAKAGYILKALELANLAEDTSDVIESILENIPRNLDKEIALEIANEMVQREQWQSAVQLYAIGGEVETAVSLAKIHHLRLCSSTLELFNIKEDISNNGNTVILEKIAELCMDSGLYSEAAQKYNQSGNKTLAIKALEKLGDVEKVIIYASAARDVEVYVSAANYLQSENWKLNKRYEKTIISFYAKAKAYDHLALFHISTAQAYAEDEEDFLKALSYSKDAAKAIRKFSNLSSCKETIDKKIKTIQSFCQKKRSSEEISELLEVLSQIEATISRL
ncbi:intraflagellar transport protein 140 homolog isoform X2 [Artemia franciscana]|uniref:intraflagellar transport protein 140 homolog isoform X2 n=1 Tax=Artemia franciscana TaxID=6661 RepID=UPI0032DAA393